MKNQKTQQRLKMRVTGNTQPLKKVLILYKFLPHYRIEFFDLLRSKLLQHNIQLDLVYSKLKNKNSSKNDERDLPWAQYRDNKIIHIGKTELIWQPCLDIATDYDLVIVEQANSLLVNYILMLMGRFGFIQFAFWGHGSNLQDNPNSLRNRFKNKLLNQSDWWFAYTNKVKNFLVQNNIEENRITVVQNAIDTVKLRTHYEDVTENDMFQAKQHLNISGENIGLYCGGIYSEKRIDFLIDAAKLIQQEISDFHLIIIGGGPDSYIAEQASQKYDWIHYLGPKFDQEKVIYFKISSLLLMPGLVGLGVLDAFTTETPMVTTQYPFHSPEIEYLQNNYNGIITENNLNSYAREVVSLLNNKTKLAELKKGCEQSRTIYTVEQMVQNFAEGVITCLAK
jgi:glycosyltransferase involved in cell wall biosynthesis